MKTESPSRFWLRTTLIALLLCWSSVLAARPFDHRHAAWTALLDKHVVNIAGGNASQLDYAGVRKDQAELQRYLASLSAVAAGDFKRFTPDQQKAFLINAYNAFTIQLVLTRYPKLESIKDIGSLLQTPWKRKFATLLGGSMSLDEIEHGWLRAPGKFDDPRVHFALNCASVGCPQLRDEAYVADRLDAQLDDQTLRFMSDRSRNRWNAAKRQLEVSQIFEWYGEDFSRGHRGIVSLNAFFARYANRLADAPADRARIRAQRVNFSYLPYDWTLNDAPRHRGSRGTDDRRR